MSTRSQIIPELARIFDRTASSVAALDRSLVESGLRAASARGRAAQAVSAGDMANVSIAIMGGWSLRQTPIMVERLGSLRLRKADFTEYSFNREGEMTDFREGDTLTAADILEPVIFEPYPRDRLPMASTLTGSFASILERLPTLDDLEWCKITLYPETSGAELAFRLGNRKYNIEFGEGNRLPPNGIHHTTSVMRTEGFRRISALLHEQ